jgi:ABC-type transport system involved in cytochrome c biogenesis permease subunit
MNFRPFWPAAAAAALAGLYFARAAVPPREGAMHLRAAGMIPVVDGGRVKPLDTLARSALVIISGRQVYKDDDGVEQPAMRWLLDVMSDGESDDSPAAKHKVFRIENDQVLRLLKLENRPQFYRYSHNEIFKSRDVLARESRRLEDLTDRGVKFDLFDEKLAELLRHLKVYEDLSHLQKPLAVPPESDDEDWRSLATVEEDVQDRVKERLLGELKRKGTDFKSLTQEQQTELVRRLPREMDATRRLVSPAADAWTDMLTAYRAGNAEAFNRSVDDYAANHLGAVPAADQRRARFETYFNQFQPFYHCLILYVFAFVLAACSWVGAAGPLRRAAVGLTVATVAVHTVALFARMYLMDRPLVFVTNLYSTAIFIGWGCALLGLVVEGLYGMGLGTAVASVAGALSLIVAHFLALDTPTGDTLQMLQAVLDTNFWLATHVTVVNLGYAATFAAGLFGIVYVGLGLCTRALAGPLGKTLAQIIYGIVCFGTLLSFLGTVLGGIWADQSWGRFWGWDPKENGALLIVIWNALILHARWGGLVKGRGVATLAVLGNIIVVWSWFATNELGIGLHAYGASSGDKRMWIDITWAAHLAIGLTAALVPLKYWRSFSPAAVRAALKPRPA